MPTLGPWKVEKGQGIHKDRVVVTAPGMNANSPLAFIPDWDEPDATDDARLIAAAPDLLDALKQLHDDTAEYCRLNNLCGWDNQVMQIARAAIEKATGDEVPVPEGQMRHRLD